MKEEKTLFLERPGERVSDGSLKERKQILVGTQDRCEEFLPLRTTCLRIELHGEAVGHEVAEAVFV